MYTFFRLLAVLLVIEIPSLMAMAQSADVASGVHSYLAQQALFDIGSRAEAIAGKETLLM